MENETIINSTKSRLDEVRARLRRVCSDLDRDPGSVKLVCISKGFGDADVRVALDAGERIFGENRVQEARGKWPRLLSLYPDVSLHFIGPLQSNKADEAVALFDVIETIDRPKIASAVAEAMRKCGKKPRFYIQVNTGEEQQKAGVLPNELPQLLSYCVEQAQLEIDGLMCIPPADQQASPHFALLNRLAGQFGLRELSMGMSNDFDLAVQLGATKIRVGSAIFGNRRKDILPTTK